MNKILSIIVFIALLGCSKNNPTPIDPILGNWKAVSFSGCVKMFNTNSILAITDNASSTPSANGADKYYFNDPDGTTRHFYFGLADGFMQEYKPSSMDSPLPSKYTISGDNLSISYQILIISGGYCGFTVNYQRQK